MVTEQQTNTSALPAPKSKKVNASAAGPALWLGILALVISLASAGYYQYRLEYMLGDVSGLKQQSQALSSTQNEQSQLHGQWRQKLADDQQTLKAIQGHVAYLDNALKQIPGARHDDWKLAEVEYLLRLANQRVMLQKEPKGADSLMKSADAILAELDDPALLVVRETIAKERMLLANALDLDRQGTYAKLQALKGFIHDTIQPPKDMALPNLEPATDNAETSFLDQLSQFVRVRYRDDAFDAPIAQEQYQIMEHSLRLMLEQAQWALIKGDQTLYEASLDNATQWLDGFIRHSKAIDFVSQLSTLKALKVEYIYPDISQSLRQLRNILEQRTYAPADAPETEKQKPIPQISPDKTEATQQEQA